MSTDIFNQNLCEICFNELENVCISPFGIDLIMSMLNDASENNTFTQINRKVNDFLGKFYIFLKEKNLLKFITLNNYIITKNIENIKQSFIDKIEKIYSVEIIDYNNVTKPLYIQKYFSDSFTLERYATMIISILHINISWKYDMISISSEFTTIAGEKLNKNFITFEKKAELLFYKKIDNLEIVEIPCSYVSDKNFKFTIICPDNNTSLFKLLYDLKQDKNKLDCLLDSESFLQKMILLEFPSFKFNSAINITDKLKNIGIVDVFTKNADLTNMFTNTSHVSKIEQKTEIDVNRNGIIATSITTCDIVVDGITLLNRPELCVNINKPFLYFIHYDNLLFFSGLLVM